MTWTHKYCRNRGFTLIELMTTVAVVAILVGIVAPGMDSFIRDNRLSSQINTLMAAIHHARAEATSRRNIMTLCASTNSSSCNTSNWENGWILFTDSNNSGNGVVDGADEILLVQEALEGGNTLRQNGFSFPATGRLQFNVNGFMYASNPTSGTLTLCDSGGAADARAVIVNVAGTSRLATDENGDGVVNNHLGGTNNVSCP